jgi:hypothetical protein
MVMAVNWPAVLADLCGGRMNTYAVSELIGVPRSTLRGWLDGSEPKHADGERVLLAWMKTTGRSRDRVPMERRELSAARMR